MRRRWLGLVVIVALAGVVLTAKARRSSSTLVPIASVSSRADARILLFADPGEAKASCGCGEVFRSVRAAAARGVTIQEIAPRQNVSVAREHRVTVEPTVLMLDGQGHELRRYEGESTETLAAIRADLERLVGSTP